MFDVTKEKILKLRKIGLSVPKISAMVHRPRSTIYKFLKKYQRTGVVEAISRKKLKPDYGSRKLTEQQINHITSQEFLVKNKHLALWERVKLIQQQWGVSITNQTLRNIYK